jgi:YegS/Rv2252/BmrU family lipid kinase
MSNQPASQQPRVFVVLNPAAGKSNPDRIRQVVGEHLESFAEVYQIYTTTGEEDLGEVVGQALEEGFNRVWAAGGDGTVSGAANGLVNSGVPLGVIPAGTGNTLARDLGIPLDLEPACELLTGRHATRTIDVMQTSDRYFLLSVSVGVSAVMTTYSSRQQKDWMGTLSYIINGIRAVVFNSFWPFEVEMDGQVRRCRASEINAANAGIIGFEPIRWGEDVRLDDGQVHLCRARVENLWEVFTVAFGVAFRRQKQLKELVCEPFSDYVEIRSQRSVPVQGDGEDHGTTPIRIDVVPGSLEIMVPREDEQEGLDLGELLDEPLGGDD